MLKKENTNSIACVSLLKVAENCSIIAFDSYLIMEQTCWLLPSSLIQVPSLAW